MHPLNVSSSALVEGSLSSYTLPIRLVGPPRCVLQVVDVEQSQHGNESEDKGYAPLRSNVARSTPTALRPSSSA